MISEARRLRSLDGLKRCGFGKEEQNIISESHYVRTWIIFGIVWGYRDLGWRGCEGWEGRREGFETGVFWAVCGKEWKLCGPSEHALCAVIAIGRDRSYN